MRNGRHSKRVSLNASTRKPNKREKEREIDVGPFHAGE
jgi:hypothetical protein